MKRVAVSVILIVTVVAAAVAVGHLGLFRRSSSKPPSGPVVPPMTQTQVASLLREWTYPGARDISQKVTLAHAQSTVQQAKLPACTRYFLVNVPPARVNRFYTARFKANESAKALAAASTASETPAAFAYMNSLEAAAPVVHPHNSSMGGCTICTGEYVIGAKVIGWDRLKQPEIVLVLVPYEPLNRINS